MNQFTYFLDMMQSFHDITAKAKNYQVLLNYSPSSLVNKTLI